MSRSLPDSQLFSAVRYRYSKWRWRVLACLLDALAAAVLGAVKRLRPPRFPSVPERILIVQLDHLGDAVLTTPLLAGLRSAYPAARIDVLASASNWAVFAADPHVDRVRVAERNWFERRPGQRATVSALVRAGLALRRERYDLGIDVRGDLLSIAILFLAGVRRRLGWTMGGGGPLLTDVVPWVPGRHEVASRQALLEALGVASGSAPRVAIGVSSDDRAIAASALANLSPDAPLLAVHLGAGTAAKRWPIGHWRGLIDRFVSDGWSVVLVGDSDDRHAARTIPEHPGVCNLAGTLSVPETVAVLERADLFLGADSGPAHLAACANVPSVVLFSGTNRVQQWRPWSRRTLVLRRRVPCRPCHRQVCPLADHPCMSEITPERVFRAARRWLNRLLRLQTKSRSPTPRDSAWIPEEESGRRR